ncbi:MAG: methyltransferase domain-containing protein [Deltaproteobacteria bacterium]|nr:methyltransferase domain-containing protein [Deltaproteobacteria bacterium]
MNQKGHEFKGLSGGVHYRRLAKLFGMGEAYYRQCIGNIRLTAGMKALDLGCGPGALSFALAQTAHPDSEITGIDISNDQLNYARHFAGSYPCKPAFENCSMDALPYPDGSFDLVMTSMAIHTTPPSVRRAAISETARVLKPEGMFLCVDWSKPRFGLLGIIWFPFLCWGDKNKDNWDNVYPQWCAEQKLHLCEDAYLNSIARRQVFKKI